MKITYYGHACFSVEAEGRHLLFDPFLTGNPHAKGIDSTTIPADFIFVSHGHGDHVGDAVAIAKRTGATVIAPFEVGEWIESKGVANVLAMNHGGAAKTAFGRVKLTAAVHSSSITDGDQRIYGGNPAGFVVETAEGAFYHAGDTALTMDMKLIAESGVALAFAALPIGDFYTMGIEDALKAADFCGASTILGLHYNTFPPITIDLASARALAAAAKKRLLLPVPGQTLVGPEWKVG